MDTNVIHTLNDPQLLAVRNKHVERMQRLHNGEKLDEPMGIWGYEGNGHTSPYADPEKWVEESLYDLYCHAELAADCNVFRPLCSQYWLYGVHFTDKVFGAFVHQNEDLWWSRGVENDIGELPVPDLEKNETWKLAQRLTLAQIEAGVQLPFYATQVLGEPWNQFFNLYRERALYGFFDKPAEMKRDLQIVTDTLLKMHSWFLKVLPAAQYQAPNANWRFQPFGCGQMCGCATHMLSNTLYEEFIRPLDEQIASLFPGGVMLHLCGNHIQHLPSWKEMPQIHAYQLNDRAMDDLEAYYQHLRPDQLVYAHPTKNVSLAKTLELTKGGAQAVISIE